MRRLDTDSPTFSYLGVGYEKETQTQLYVNYNATKKSESYKLRQLALLP